MINFIKYFTFYFTILQLIFFFSVEKNVLRPLNQNQLSNGTRDRSNKNNLSSSSMVPKGVVNPVIKCTTRFKRSYIELDDEMISVITDVEGLNFFFFEFKKIPPRN